MQKLQDTFAGAKEAPRRPPSPLNMLRMEEGPEEGGPLAAGPAGSPPDTGGTACACAAPPSARFPSTCRQETLLREDWHEACRHQHQAQKGVTSAS